MVATGARVHGRGQDEPCRVGETQGGPAQRDDAVFQRLAEHLEHVPTELGELVEKEDAPVGEAHLTGPRA
jgi:hypothetical protein